MSPSLSSLPKIFLKPERDKLARNHHPWVFSGAIGRIEGAPDAGEIVEVLRADGTFVAQGQYNPSSKIRLRLMEWTSGETVDESWYRRALRQALAARKVVAARSDAYRVVFAESDFIPGLIVDRLGSWLVVQFLTSGAERVKPLIVRLLCEEMPGLSGILEKSDGDGRRMEGLPESHGLLWGEPPDEEWTVRENGLDFLVAAEGQKTGFYTDQRDNRELFARLVPGRTMLDVFCYSGAFSIYGLKSGAASSLLTDASGEALQLAERNLRSNGLTGEFLQGDAFEVLRSLKKSGRRFGAVCLDPPKLAATREVLDRALRAYKDLNLQALALVEPGGLLATFSCSGAVSAADFREMLAFAAKDAGREVQILHQLHQASCHPVRLSMPEGEYLKGLLVRVL